MNVATTPIATGGSPCGAWNAGRECRKHVLSRRFNGWEGACHFSHKRPRPRWHINPGVLVLLRTRSSLMNSFAWKLSLVFVCACECTHPAANPAKIEEPSLGKHPSNHSTQNKTLNKRESLQKLHKAHRFHHDRFHRLSSSRVCAPADEVSTRDNPAKSGVSEEHKAWHEDHVANAPMYRTAGAAAQSWGRLKVRVYSTVAPGGGSGRLWKLGQLVSAPCTTTWRATWTSLASTNVSPLAASRPISELRSTTGMASHAYVTCSEGRI